MQCPCFSKKKYDECCKPFHAKIDPPSAELLMRSRFSAYALNLADYIIKTTHPDSFSYHKDFTKWKEEIANFSKESKFKDLQIIDSFEEDSIAFITFIAYIQHLEEDATFTERSYFIRENGKWFYRDGIVKRGVKTNEQMLQS